MKILHLLSGGNVGGIETLCLEIGRLSRDKQNFCFLFEGGIIADKMEQSKYSVYRYYELNAAIRLRTLFQLVKKENFDVVVVHHEGIGTYLFYLFLRYCFPRIRYMKYLHCSFDRQDFATGKLLHDRLYYYLLKKTLQKSDRMIAVSNYVKDSYCKEFKCGKEKISVIYNGIPEESIAEKKRLRAAGEEIHLIYVGRLAKIKGVDCLLYAMKKLVDRGEKLELNILGDGPERTELEQLTRKLNLEKQVHFRGFVLDKESYWDCSQIYVCPSICQEAFGISVVEAMANGMICLAANVGGIPEIIDDGRNGFLYENDAEQTGITTALTGAIAICRGGYAADMIASARRRAQDFTISKTIQNIELICRES